MDKKAAVTQYHYGELAKSELMMASQLITVISGLKGLERVGGQKVVIQSLEVLITELKIAGERTGNPEFEKSATSLNDAISFAESENPEDALPKIAEAMTPVTTVAQQAMQEMQTHGYI